jgi:hypothetical protein
MIPRGLPLGGARQRSAWLRPHHYCGRAQSDERSQRDRKDNDPHGIALRGPIQLGNAP